MYVCLFVCMQGMNVLFQDVDLVWLRDPLAFIQDLFRNSSTSSRGSSTSGSSTSRTSSGSTSSKLVSFLSDDGARTTRYAPFFANSGFFYLAAGPENVYFAYSVMTAFDILLVAL